MRDLQESTKLKMVSRVDLVPSLLQAFIVHGFDAVTMGELAAAAKVTRRTLYNHFENKEDAFRFIVRTYVSKSIADAIAAGYAGIAAGQSPTEVLVTLFDVRFAAPRRLGAQSAHLAELRNLAITRCDDVISELSIDFIRQLGVLLSLMSERGLLRLKPDIPIEVIARSLADAIRGANYAFPAVPLDELTSRYRDVVTTVLFGFVSQDDAVKD